MEKIIILETSDIHGSVLPLSYADNSYAEKGLVKIASIIKRLKSEFENVLLIDNGDLIQGTPLTYHYVKFLKNKQNPMIKLLNYLEYDAAVIGNHEFNYGMAVLNRAVSESNFPWLSANICHGTTKETYFGKPYMTKRFANGIKAAVLGLTTHYIPNWENPDHIRELYFEDALLAAKRWVDYIHEVESPDLLIVSYHGGFENSVVNGIPTETYTGENQAYRICMEVDGIDILLTGHQHRELTEEINGVTVIQPGCNGEKLGKAAIELEKKSGNWSVVNKTPEILDVQNEKADCHVVGLIEEYEKKTQEWLDEEIGKIKGNMLMHDPFRARMEEHPLIEFINKVQMEATGAPISSTALFSNDSLGFPSKVTMRDLVSNYIYPNTLIVLLLKGQDIKDALERSASYFSIAENEEITVNPAFSYPKPQHYNYDMWEGIEYIINAAKPIGDRIESLHFQGRPLSMKAEYEVVMNNYRAGGGGDYKMFKGKQMKKEIQMDMPELLAEYFIKHGTVKAAVNHNWKVVNQP
ncbi:bifunctional metallophosphatase/5'-nucleotidase [Falsibacillus pallidus]|uniref:2',3'-cyclic-nucleotide 2'-phosphodiesterase/3'-nucleotidase n=1 Tax=Falsibacillus pallidus TaxID=493781 RepID=A0A370GYG0_9BACI|nr:bifunctional UDP-sugar hydrolase/5'-nucleotidase [Falsibacillus pallidus]RDI47674.1 2',3'-cyclic-nucleotide 2'-phosphodiesterase/3'-nucleotidase [Falsibacillus pallidus]